MEGKPHCSEAYDATGRLSRMKEDLQLCSRDFVSSFQHREASRRRALASDKPRIERPHVGIVGAGLAGLRCAEVLVAEGVQVTVLEARDRVGGRIHQADLLGQAVDMGPNWIHGTENNPMVKLAQDTNTTLCSVDDSTCMYDPQGLPIDNKQTTAGLDKMWDLISEAFKYSNEDGPKIDPSLSLKDFFRTKLAEQALSSKEQELILLLSEIWGSFIGDPWEKQSLKWFWLEECLDGDNLFVEDSHAAILRRITDNVLAGADVHLGAMAKSIERVVGEGEDPKVLVRMETRDFEFDEVVVAVPLGCLKRETPTFVPSIPRELCRAINNASYSSLEKVYVAFPVDFWRLPNSEPDGGQDEVPAGTSSHLPGFAHFLQPNYVPDQQKTWTIELVTLSSPAQHPGGQAQATLLFSMYGQCAVHVTSLINNLSPTSPEYFNALVDFFRPYYSLLPNYKPGHPDCTPLAILATDWQNDDLAGNGSYTNFQVSDAVEQGGEEVLLDDGVRAMRTGMPDRGIWFAGEHTAPFVALGTSTGAYWSGESAAVRILAANGLMPEQPSGNGIKSNGGV